MLISSGGCALVSSTRAAIVAWAQPQLAAPTRPVGNAGARM
jgi:hypothetical protein